MAVTSTDIANRALKLSGNDGPPITGAAPLFDNSTAGKVAASFYVGCVQTIGRQFQWDFARQTAALTKTANAAPYPWQFEYAYPLNCIEVWNLFPSQEDDPYDPLPVNFVIANDVVAGVQQRVVHTNLDNALAVFNNYPIESTWDALFTEAVVRLLASEFSTALLGKPDLAQSLLQSGSAFEQIGEARID